MDFRQQLKELEERFLKRDEGLEDLPNPTPADADLKNDEAQLMLSTVLHSLSTAHQVLTIFNLPRYQEEMDSLLNEDAKESLKRLREALEDSLSHLDPDEFEEEEDAEEELDEPQDEVETDEEDSSLDSDDESEDEDDEDSQETEGSIV